jgi:tetratricopeptide (TPR) repeat protein
MKDTLPPILSKLGGLDALEPGDLLDARFLGSLVLPAHGRWHAKAYRESLKKLKGKLGPKALAGRARIKRLLGDMAGAEADLVSSLKRMPGCPEALAFRAEMTLLKDPSEALKHLDAAVAVMPDWGPARLWRSQALSLLDRPEAGPELDQAVRLFKTPGGARLFRAARRERLGDAAGAVEDLSVLIKAFPRIAGLWTLRATAYAKLGRFAEAVEDSHRALDEHPENQDGFVRVLYAMEGVKAAVDRGSEKDVLIAACRRRAAADPKAGWPHALEATLLGQSRLQLEPLRKALALDPKRAWVEAFLGRALGDDRRAGGGPGPSPEALDALSRASKLKPDAGWIRCWRAEVLQSFGKDREALKEVETGLKLDPAYRLAFAWRANLRKKFGDKKGALADLTEVLEALPRPSFRYQRALSASQAGKHALAYEDLCECVRVSPAHAFGYSPLPWLFGFRRLQHDSPGGLARSPHSTGTLLSWSRRAKKRPMHRRDIPPCEGYSDPFLFRPETPVAGAAAMAWHGRRQLDEGKAVPARVALDAAVKKDPALFAARLWRAEALVSLGLWHEAAADLDEALKLSPGSAIARLWRGLARWRLKRQEEALEDLLAAYRADPANAFLCDIWARVMGPSPIERRKASTSLAKTRAAELELRAGRPGSALRLLRNLTGEAALVLRGFAWLGRGVANDAGKELFSAVRGWPAEASARIERLLKELPGARVTFPAYAALAEAETRLGRPGDRPASVAKRLAVEASDESPLGLSLRSAAALEEGRLELAVTYALRGFALEQTGPAASALARARAACGDNDGAIEAASHGDPDESEGRAWAAVALARQGHGAKALAALREEGMPRWAALVAAELSLHEQDADDAHAALRAAGEKDPDAAGPRAVLGETGKMPGEDSKLGVLYAWRGAVRRRQGRLEDAAADFERALTLCPDAPWTRAWRGELALAAGKPDAALPDLTAAAALLPGDPDFAVWRGRALCELGRCSEARAEFDRALSKQPLHVWALVAAGVCREKQGDKKGAMGFYEKAKSLAPGLFGG